MKVIQIAAGCKTRIIRRQFSSLAITYTFDAVPTIQDDDLLGTVEIKRSAWIFPKPVQKMTLQSNNTVKAGVWDTFFSIYVIPEVDVAIALPSKSFAGLPWLMGLVAVAVVVLVAIAFLLLT